ncbi:hypothetical protein AABB24_011248 [Solanum stoloniferum]|uniref:Gag-pol polyprotein n=1 Tax=Solanum stoloniferum TaxID=62892 RepID=A0ABD2UCC9_9SOLN
MMCDYCKRPGHTREKCYKIYGYPQTSNYQNSNQNGYRNNNQNFNPNKGKGPMADVQGFSSNVRSTEGEDHRGEHVEQDPQLTREQYNQFVELLQQFQAEKHWDNVNGSVNFAGPFNEEASGDW